MRNEYLIHCVARCSTCGKEWEDYKTAKKQAVEHARKTKHHVIVETGYFIEHNKPSPS